VGTSVTDGCGDGPAKVVLRRRRLTYQLTAPDAPTSIPNRSFSSSAGPRSSFPQFRYPRAAPGSTRASTPALHEIVREGDPRIPTTGTPTSRSPSAGTATCGLARRFPSSGSTSSSRGPRGTTRGRSSRRSLSAWVCPSFYDDYARPPRTGRPRPKQWRTARAAAEPAPSPAAHASA
jgi:hypothetical protein